MENVKGKRGNSGDLKWCLCVVSSDTFMTSEVVESLRSPTFDNWQYNDAQMIVLLRQMFIDLDLVSKCHIDVRIAGGC